MDFFGSMEIDPTCEFSLPQSRSEGISFYGFSASPRFDATKTQSGHSSEGGTYDGAPQPVIRLNGGGPRPQTLGSLKARHLVTKRPKKKLSHLYFGPVGGGERQDLIRQPRPSASFVERRQFKNAFADQLFPNVIKNWF